MLLRRVAGFVEARQILRARAENRDVLALGHAPQCAGIGVEGRAVVEHQRRAGRQSARQPVPHHPAASREEEQTIAATQVNVQQMLLRMLQQRAARAVHDALRFTGGARRVHDEQRLVERQSREREFGPRRAEACPMHHRACVRRRLQRTQVWRFRHVAHHYDGAHGRQLCDHGGHWRERVDRLAGVVVAVCSDQYGGADLTKAIEYAGDAKVGRAR